MNKTKWLNGILNGTGQNSPTWHAPKDWRNWPHGGVGRDAAKASLINWCKSQGLLK